MLSTASVSRRSLKLTNDGVVTQQEPDVIQHNAAVVAVIELDVHILVVDVGVRRAGSRGDARVQAAVLLTPECAQPGAGRHFRR